MSDDYGRKRLLLLSYAMPSFGYMCMGLSGSVLALTLSRIPSGNTMLSDQNIIKGDQAFLIKVASWWKKFRAKIIFALALLLGNKDFCKTSLLSSLPTY